MNSAQKIIRYFAVALAVLLIAAIFSAALGVFSGLGRMFGSDSTVAEKLEKREIDEEISSLEIDLTFSDLQIISGETFSLETNLTDLDVSQKDGNLILSQKQRLFAPDIQNALVRLQIPAEAVFDSLEINAGAGRVQIEALRAKDLKLSLGAGEVSIESLVAERSADIDGGAGKLTVSDGSFRDLDLDMGVGELKLTSALLGESELDLGVGAVELTLLGEKEDYSLLVDRGVGEIEIEGEKLKTGTRWGSGTQSVDIDGGIGQIEILFQNEA